MHAEESGHTPENQPSEHEHGRRGSRSERGERGMRGGPRERGGEFREHGVRHHRHPGGARGRRGDIRAAILIALQEDPAHGYELMQSLASRSGGRWRPSPGSVYPTLQMLEDEGLLSSEEIGGKRVFTLTEAGATEAAARRESAGDVMPWERDEDENPASALRDAVQLFELAARQASLTRDNALTARVTEVVNAARKSIYQLLAE